MRLGTHGGKDNTVRWSYCEFYCFLDWESQHKNYSQSDYKNSAVGTGRAGPAGFQLAAQILNMFGLENVVLFVGNKGVKYCS